MLLISNITRHRYGKAGHSQYMSPSPQHLIRHRFLTIPPPSGLVTVSLSLSFRTCPDSGHHLSPLTTASASSLSPFPCQEAGGSDPFNAHLAQKTEPGSVAHAHGVVLRLSLWPGPPQLAHFELQRYQTSCSLPNPFTFSQDS